MFVYCRYLCGGTLVPWCTLFMKKVAVACKKSFLFITSPLQRSTVKPVYNDHPWDPQKVAVVHRLLLCRGFSNKSAINVRLAGLSLAVVNRWPLFRGGR